MGCQSWCSMFLYFQSCPYSCGASCIADFWLGSPRARCTWQLKYFLRLNRHDSQTDSLGILTRLHGSSYSSLELPSASLLRGLVFCHASSPKDSLLQPV